MSETPRTHSEQSKRKIGSSLKQLWAKRLKLKRSKEKFFYSWTESIADAAKKGGIEEEQLCWDSYEIQKNAIACRRRQQNEKKAKEVEIQRVQAVKRKQGSGQNTGLLAENKLDHKQDDPRAEQKATRSCRTRNKNKQKVKSMLKKIKERKSVEESFRSHSGVMSDLQSALEKFDIESIKEEQKRKTMSLADQIQAAKSRRRR